MKINLSKLSQSTLQYILIYGIFTLCGSLLFTQYQNVFLYATVFLFIILFLINKHNRLISPVLMCGVLLVSVLFVRVVSGEIGINAWLLNSAQFLIVYCAFYIDKENFLDRYVKLTCIMAVISVIGFVLNMAMPSILDRVLISRIHRFNKAETYTTLYRGLLFFTCTSVDMRNFGIYTEPGRYQAMLNGALFCVLFCQKYLNMDKKQSLRAIIILAITIVTTRSTTGYIMMGTLFVGYILLRKDEFNYKLKRTILAVALLGTAILLVDFVRNGADSIVGAVVLGKLEDTDIDDMSSSGGARLRMIEICLRSIVEKPWGMGTLSVEGNNVSAGILKYIASFGVVPGIYILVWIFRPISKSFQGKIELVSFIIIYVYLGLAQTFIFYSGLLVVPIALDVLRKRTEVET